MIKNKHDRQHLKNLRLLEKRVDQIYQQAVREAALIGVSLHGFNASKPFSFADQAITQRKAEKLVRWLEKGLKETITGSVKNEWSLANTKNNALADNYLKGKHVPDTIRNEYYNSNGGALEAFLTRKDNGMNLSDRVWRYSDQFKKEVELGLDLGIRAGRSADEISRDLRLYLQHPDKLYRRIRYEASKDESGNPVYKMRLSKAAEVEHTGRGVYRSSYKNARRLAATETNMAYRTADHLRWQQMDFVIGQHVLLSNNHTLNGMKFRDICDELSGKNEEDKRGRYPKDFKFTGWHPLCRCFVVPILADADEFEESLDREDKGEEYKFTGTVDKMPREFNEWVVRNKKRIGNATSYPRFIKDNLNRTGKAQAEVYKQDGSEVLLGKPSDIYVSTDRIKRAIQNHLRENPEFLPTGIDKVEVIKTGEDGFFRIARATGKERGAFTLQVANYDFAVGQDENGQNIYYNPAKRLDEAIALMSKRKPLSFQQEYAVEGLWHELKHGASPRWSEGMPHDKTQDRFMETLNQLSARHTYGEFMSGFNCLPSHLSEVISEGYAYNKEVSNMLRLVEKTSITKEQYVGKINELLSSTPYEKLQGEMEKFLEEGKLAFLIPFLSKIGLTPTVFSAQLLSMGV